MYKTKASTVLRRSPPSSSLQSFPGDHNRHSPPQTTALMAQPPFDPFYLYQHDEQSNINTLFVSGLPDDVKAREIHNLFRRCPGFDSCQLKYTGRANQVPFLLVNSSFSLTYYYALKLKAREFCMYWIKFSLSFFRS